MLVSFDLTRGWGLLVAGAAVLAILFVYVTAGEKLYKALRKLRPKPPSSGADDSAEPADPYVVLGHPEGDYSTTPLSELADGEHSRLIRVEPRYLIENKDPSVGIRDVTVASRQTPIGTRLGSKGKHAEQRFLGHKCGRGRAPEIQGAQLPLRRRALVGSDHPNYETVRRDIAL